MSIVNLDGVGKRYGSVVAVAGVDLEIGDGEFIVLVGPSGCGKSTTLRMIAGLEQLSQGTIRVDGSIINNLAPKDRDIAMVFQSYALYPHMTVFANMAFGLKMKKVGRHEIAARIQEVATMLNIADLLERKPRELSGGQRQRVAMGRAMVRRPKVFLFDEPLSNLDAGLRAQMRVEIKKLHRKIGTTTVYVTHDQVEAMTLADRIVLMDRGRVIQVADPMTMYERPATKFVAGFIGTPRMNFLRGLLDKGTDGNLAMHIAPNIVLPIPPSKRTAYAAHAGRTMEIGLRAEHLTVGLPAAAGATAFEATIDVVEPMGSDGLAFFTVNGTEVAAKCPGNAIDLAGKTTRLAALTERLHLIEPESGRVIPA